MFKNRPASRGGITAGRRGGGGGGRVDLCNHEIFADISNGVIFMDTIERGLIIRLFSLSGGGRLLKDAFF